MYGKADHVGSVVFGVGLCVSGAVVLAAVEVPFVIGLLLLVVGLAFAGNGARHLLARRAFAEVEFSETRPGKLGGTAELILSLTPKRPLTLTPGGSKLTLTCAEKAVYSAGTASRTYTDVLHTQAQLVELPKLLSQRLEQRFTVAIPAHVPPTWKGEHNSFVTAVELRVDIDGWPDLVLQTEIQVLPEFETHGG